MVFLKYLLLISLITGTSSCFIFSPKKTIPSTTNARIDTLKKNANVIKPVIDSSKKIKKDTLRTSFINSLDSTRPVRIAVLAPLYLDSAFYGNTYNLGKSNIPKFFMPGLEFYDGVMMAVDSLNKEKEPAEIWIYDTRKKGQTIQSITAEMQKQKISMVLASVTNPAEQKTLSDFSFNNSVPVISATYPNDASLSGNPFFIMINSTWKTHADAVYKYVQQNYYNKNIFLITKTGTLENKILNRFNELKKTGRFPIAYSVMLLNDDFSEEDILPHLDSTKQNVIICGTLDEDFGRNLIRVLNDAQSYNNTVAIGTPTWNGMAGTSGSACSNIQLIITTPFNYVHGYSRLNTLSANYKAKYYARPSDMAYRGFESMYHFTKLLIYNKSNFINKVSDTSFKIINDFKIEPVRLSSNTFVPDYLENKKIYFIKVVHGDVQSVN
ncbi:MAG: ABC transporter substrate-binding protein [Parafilimonas sp.]